MDVYHKILIKLYEATGGKDAQTVDFKELVKGEGFLGNYDDIFALLSSKGWIAETNRADTVKITHWGVKEAKASQNGLPDASETRQNETKKLISETKQFLIMLEEFASDEVNENFKQVEKKFDELNSAFVELKMKI
jgi:hypothetical protein